MESFTNIVLLGYVLLIASANADIIGELIKKMFLEPRDIVVVVLSSKEGYHIANANSLRKSIYEQADILEKEAPKVVLSHELSIKGSWIIIPLLVHLVDTFPNTKWFFFCLENTVIRLEKLLNVLEKFSASQDMWIGHALYDHEPTIIHHFAQHKRKFKYPHIAPGFAITSKLLKSLSQRTLKDETLMLDFSIDASYEFASFVLKNTNVRLTHVSKICVVSGTDCATYPRFFHPCNSSVFPKNVYFAVKTCTKYHTDRIPTIKNSWAKYAANIGYFSDAADEHLWDAHVVPNTTQGHCAKTYGILREASNIIKSNNFDWLIISDDDTIFSVARLLRLLTCYNPKNLVAIGERYGFRMWDPYGYEYLTGGAGVVLSATLVHRMVETDVCTCPSATTPDDMYLFGVCLSQIGVEPVHSSMFHQARPLDYATARLASQDPISFHKFWMIEPEAVYNEWFAEADAILSKPPIHTEL